MVVVLSWHVVGVRSIRRAPMTAATTPVVMRGPACRCHPEHQGAPCLALFPRTSKLTRLLQDVLANSAYTTLVLCASPDAIDAQESLSTIKFGVQAKDIRVQPRAPGGTSPPVQAAHQVRRQHACSGGAALSSTRALALADLLVAVAGLNLNHACPPAGLRPMLRACSPGHSRRRRNKSLPPRRQCMRRCIAAAWKCTALRSDAARRAGGGGPAGRGAGPAQGPGAAHQTQPPAEGLRRGGGHHRCPDLRPLLDAERLAIVAREGLLVASPGGHFRSLAVSACFPPRWC